MKERSGSGTSGYVGHARCAVLALLVCTTIGMPPDAHGQDGSSWGGDLHLGAARGSEREEPITMRRAPWVFSSG